MGKRSRRPTNPKQRAALPAPQPPAGPRPASDPDRLLLNAIADGELDHALSALADAINARRHLLHTVKAATALAQLCVGDEVRINHTVTPKYLRGIRGRVIALDDDSATVCLHRPVGRFKSGHVRCPPLALDRLHPHAAAS
ncbi:MAG: hypothetical protein LC790_15210 [Actinobacteria bacterium]|nr:hypothetical protein [Actinomycetota bacterium]MCA1700172.1 hypothetical protein [Actinomycetota bacterium]